jgi:hypothetical protein
MQDINPTGVLSSKITYILDTSIVLFFDRNMKYEPYSCEWYHGIIFYIPGDGNILTGDFGRYDVIHNKYMGNRILISNAEGWKDIPFKKATFGFLPPGVEASEACLTM